MPKCVAVKAARNGDRRLRQTAALCSGGFGHNAGMQLHIGDMRGGTIRDARHGSPAGSYGS
jgi:hypothetical protein